MTGQTETLLHRESKPEMEVAANYLDRLPVNDQKEMLVFMQGMLFARGIDGHKEAPAQQAGWSECITKTACLTSG